MTESNSMKTGTTTVGLVTKDAAILGADKRVTMGNYIHSREIKKIIPFAEHLAMTLSGSVGDNQMLGRVMAKESKKYEMENEQANFHYLADRITKDHEEMNRLYAELSRKITRLEHQIQQQDMLIIDLKRDAE